MKDNFLSRSLSLHSSRYNSNYQDNARTTNRMMAAETTSVCNTECAILLERRQEKIETELKYDSKID